MSKQTTLAVVVIVLLFLVAGDSWAQVCPIGMTAITADRDNTLYEDAGGGVSNGAGDYIFAGRTGLGFEEIRRGLVHFDVAGTFPPGVSIAQAFLQLTVDQPRNNGTRSIGLHLVEADWGEVGSQGGMGEGGGGAAATGDATWVHTFFDSASWTAAGGDFDATAVAVTAVDSGVNGVNVWSSPEMAGQVQSWFDTPSTNFGWLLLGDETASATAVRFGSRENAGSEPTLCVRTCGAALPCTVFSDGFESGDDTEWSASVP